MLGARGHETAKTTKKHALLLKESRPQIGEPNLKTQATRRRNPYSNKARKKEGRHGCPKQDKRQHPGKAKKNKKRGKYTRRKIKSYTNERARQAGKQEKNPEEKKQAERKATQKGKNSNPTRSDRCQIKAEGKKNAAGSKRKKSARKDNRNKKECKPYVKRQPYTSKGK